MGGDDVPDVRAGDVVRQLPPIPTRNVNESHQDAVTPIIKATQNVLEMPSKQVASRASQRYVKEARNAVGDFLHSESTCLEPTWNHSAVSSTQRVCFDILGRRIAGTTFWETPFGERFVVQK